MNGVGGTNDCIAYIAKIASFASNWPSGTIFISASKSNYGNTSWYFDGGYSPGAGVYTSFATQAALGVSNALSSPSITYTTNTHILQATNVAGYWSGGTDSGLGGPNNSFATNGQVTFSGSSGWFIMATVDSFNGERETGQAGFLTWFATNAFLGTNYSTTPIGAVTHVDEPYTDGEENTYVYYRDWAVGRPFGITAWHALFSNGNYNFKECAVVGDPFTMK
jgi:hypothetical protein